MACAPVSNSPDETHAANYVRVMVVWVVVLLALYAFQRYFS